jgi:DNA gyrase subunit B
LSIITIPVYLEYGGSPDKAVRLAFTAEIDSYLKQASKYTKGESKITFADIEDSLIIVTNTFSTIRLMKTRQKNQ